MLLAINKSFDSIVQHFLIKLLSDIIVDVDENCGMDQYRQTDRV